MSEDFITAHLGQLQDFWQRREAVCAHQRRYAAFGFQVQVDANAAQLLEAADLSARRACLARPLADARPLRFSLLLDRSLPDQPLPADWPTRVRRRAMGPWLLLNCAPWLNAFANLDTRECVALVSPNLADEARLLSRNLFDTVTLNALMRTGVGMLHASALVKAGHDGPERLLLLAAPHNTGKSTTALHLALNGFRLLADGMTYVRPLADGVEIMGYPVGEAKLRPDMLSRFPQLVDGQEMWVREDRKLIYDLLGQIPAKVQRHSVLPQRVVLAYLTRGDRVQASAAPLAPDEMLERLWPESTFVEPPAVLQSHHQALRQLLSEAACHQVCLGTDLNSSLATLEQLTDDQ